MIPLSCTPSPVSYILTLQGWIKPPDYSTDTLSLQYVPLFVTPVKYQYFISLSNKMSPLNNTCSTHLRTRLLFHLQKLQPLCRVRQPHPKRKEEKISLVQKCSLCTQEALSGWASWPRPLRPRPLSGPAHRGQGLCSVCGGLRGVHRARSLKGKGRSPLRPVTSAAT